MVAIAQSQVLDQTPRSAVIDMGRLDWLEASLPRVLRYLVVTVASLVTRNTESASPDTKPRSKVDELSESACA